ncbi:MAG: hypothetical protein JNM57_06265 [Cyclobacteriaceae bacterium]|nr:hypothetical protein [Cyclobacteriaceae bacterium]
MSTDKVVGLLFFLCTSFTVLAQDDLMKMLDEETSKDAKPDYTTATFKSTRLINGQSVENVAGGVLDFRISHRFGYINSGAYELWGLDNATTRIGLDYGLSNRWMIGVGRSTYLKQYDGFTKFKLLRQSSGSKTIPLTVSAVASMIYKSVHFDDPTRENYYTSNMLYAFQLLLARKFSEGVSFQLMPTMVHVNLAPGTSPNDLYSIGVGGRIKISKRVSINAEYYYQLPGFKWENTFNSVAFGVDIETGGHVFQLQFTNSTGMTEPTFINQTTGDFWNGDIHFGFNISRVFTIKDPRKK